MPSRHQGFTEPVERPENALKSLMVHAQDLTALLQLVRSHGPPLVC